MFVRQTFRSAGRSLPITRSYRTARLGAPVPIPQSQTPEEFADFQPGIGPQPQPPASGFPTSAPPGPAPQNPAAPQPPMTAPAAAPAQQTPVAPAPTPQTPVPAPAAPAARPTREELRLQSLIIAWQELCKAKLWPALLTVQTDLINQYGFTITDFNYETCTVTASPEPV